MRRSSAALVLAAGLLAPVGPQVARPASAPILSTVPSTGTRQAEAEVEGGFLVYGAADTLAIESFRRTDRRLQGDLLDRAEGNRRESYIVFLGADGAVDRIELAVRPASSARDTPPVRRAAVTFFADQAIAETANGDSRTRLRVDVPAGALPYLALSGALMEQLSLRAQALGHERLEIPLVDVESGRALSAEISRFAGDSLVIHVDGLEVHAQVDSTGRILGGRIPERGLTIERVESLEVEAARHVDYSAPPGAPYLAEDVRVRASATHELAGTLTLPTFVAGPFPGVILVTGSGPQERDASFLGSYRPFRQIADVLSRQGVAVLRLDDRGVGASTGRFTTATSADFAEDVRAAIVYLRNRPEIDPARIGLLGESEGGLVASMVAASDPRLQALVLMGTPSRTGRNLIASQVRWRLEREGRLPPAERESVIAGLEARNDRLARVLPWLKFILDYDPLATARQVSTPVLIMQGETDRQVFAHQAEELAVAFRAGSNHDVTVQVFSGLNHLFLEDLDGDPDRYAGLTSKALPAGVLETIADWMATRLL